MVGVILGDIIGSSYELEPIKTKNFELFNDNSKITDDTIMSLAVFKAVNEAKNDFKLLEKLTIKYMRYFGNKYKDAGYGYHFNMWLESNDPKPYKSYGNGSIMRIKACALLHDNLDDALRCGDVVTNVTHNHSESLKAVEVLIKVIFMAKNNKKIDDIKKEVDKYYKLDKTINELRKDFEFDTNVTNTIKAVLTAFFESENFIDAIKNAVSLGGDSDTIASITGGLAASYYKVDKIYDVIVETYLYDDELIDIYNEYLKLRNKSFK